MVAIVCLNVLFTATAAIALLKTYHTQQASSNLYIYRWFTEETKIFWENISGSLKLIQHGKH